MYATRFTVYTVMSTKTFFEKQGSDVFEAIFSTSLDVVLSVNITVGRLQKLTLSISSVIIGMRLSLF